jgi:hypothetical protein
MNNKKEVVPLRSRKGSIYQRGSNETFKISRSKFSNFIDCERCFYLERVKGLKDPSMPGWALNSAVDELLKKEFDHYRKLQEPHPFIVKNKLKFIPFQHEKIDYWRDALRGGISFLDENTNLEIHGGVDDIWFDKDKSSLDNYIKVQNSDVILINEGQFFEDLYEVVNDMLKCNKRV